jgi:hypothetical protein
VRAIVSKVTIGLADIVGLHVDLRATCNRCKRSSNLSCYALGTKGPKEKLWEPIHLKCGSEVNSGKMFRRFTYSKVNSDAFVLTGNGGLLGRVPLQQTSVHDPSMLSPHFKVFCRLLTTWALMFALLFSWVGAHCTYGSCHH